ncbi:MAG: hypothetical protein J3R72DRAFT_449744 [Linnemannia gamsii]|nr:MAG: hypothetical protein J3R72DRAFT_449744 [Linnemannia gamsii]
MSSNERVLSTTKAIQLLRIYVCLATFLNILVLARSRKFPTHEESGTHGKYPGASFMISFPLVFNSSVFVGTMILLRYPGG